MQNFSASPYEMAASFWRNRSLIYALSKREMVGRYRGSFFGILWSFFNPLLMLIVYAFIFLVVFKARWHGGEGSKVEFALLIFSGLIFFNFFAECIIAAPAKILNNANYVERVVFPLEILSWVSILVASINALISLGVWILAYVFFFGALQPTIIWFPLVFIPFGLFTLGMSWFLSALGVYVRDILQIISIALSALMFLSPIFYSVKSLPDGFKKFIELNPLAFPVEQAREVLYWGAQPKFEEMFVYFLFSISSCWLGFIFFQKLRKGFADVI